MEALLYCDFKAIEDYAKEFEGLNDICMQIFDRPETLKSNLGQLQKNRILGIFLWLKNTNKSRVTTQKIEAEYEKFFKPISRSSISNYLNQLIKENVLKKQKVGKTVFYEIAHEIPTILDSDPFWFVKNFCIYPVYICRTSYFARKLRIEKNKEVAYVYKLINYNLVRNRIKKCLVCPFGIKKQYKTVLEKLEKQYITLKNLLPKQLVENIEGNFGELKIFNGISLFPSWLEVKGKIENLAKDNKKELNNQIDTIVKEWEISKEES